MASSQISTSTFFTKRCESFPALTQFRGDGPSCLENRQLYRIKTKSPDNTRDWEASEKEGVQSGFFRTFVGRVTTASDDSFSAKIR